MALNNYQPLTNYSRAVQQPINQSPMQTTANQPLSPNPPVVQPYQQIGMNWVKGLAGANDYPVARGGTLALFDQDAEMFYIKSVDMYNNQPSIRAFSYEEVPIEQLNGTVDMTKYVTIDKFNELQEELEELKTQQKSRNQQYTKYNKKKEDHEQ